MTDSTQHLVQRREQLVCRELSPKKDLYRTRSVRLRENSAGREEMGREERKQVHGEKTARGWQPEEGPSPVLGKRGICP